MKTSKTNLAIGLGSLIFLLIGSMLFYRNNVAKATLATENYQAGVIPGGTSAQDASGAVTATSTATPTPRFDGANVKVKGLYLTGHTVNNPKNVEHFVKLAKETEINAYVVDIKDDDGLVGYETSVQTEKDVKGWQKKYNPDLVLKAFHDNNIYVIGRIVCFKDPILGLARPELAIKQPNGSLWRDNHGKPWLNPYNKDVWPIILGIAKEAVQKGFDEIQFDYVRFANDGPKRMMDFSAANGKPKYEAINEFLEFARKELPGVRISADVFGIICESPQDTEGIGQYLEMVGKNIDCISPMAYPSHYAPGQIVNGVKFPKPDLDPYGVVYHTLLKAKDRISKTQDYKAKVRPYIQDFTATWLGKGYYKSYTEKEVKEQIKAVKDAGYEEWLIWDAQNTYSEGAYQKESSLATNSQN